MKYLDYFMIQILHNQKLNYKVTTKKNTLNLFSGITIIQVIKINKGGFIILDITHQHVKHFQAFSSSTGNPKCDSETRLNANSHLDGEEFS